MSNVITLQELKSHLWESANILRGTIDSSDYKNYIFGLLFFKRLSDTFDEEYASFLPLWSIPLSEFISFRIAS